MSFLRALCEFRDSRNRGKVPGPLIMADGTRVMVERNGIKEAGTFRGASPDGNYHVLLDSDSSNGSYETVELLVKEK